MKKTLLLFCLLSMSAHAQYQHHDSSSPTLPARGGFVGQDTASIVTVKQAKQLADDAWVSLKGQIIAKIGDEDYLFKDASGQITIEVDHDIWQGLTISSKDFVIITGEVDRDWHKIKIDVKQIKKTK